MNHTHLNNDQVVTYLELADLAQDINKAIDCFDLAILKSDIPIEVKTRCLAITRALHTFGLAYRLTPQSEWTGGESFKMRSPHIANEV